MTMTPVTTSPPFLLLLSEKLTHPLSQTNQNALSVRRKCAKDLIRLTDVGQNPPTSEKGTTSWLEDEQEEQTTVLRIRLATELLSVRLSEE